MIGKRKLLTLIITAFACLCNRTSFSQTISLRNQISTKVDNDVFTLSRVDRYYTNGLFAAYQTALKHNSVKIEKTLFSAEIGQEIFTAYSVRNKDPQKIDRPFAGYLFVKAATSFLYKREQKLSIAINLGVIGPTSGAESFQKNYHALFGFAKPNGWQYQISNMPVINASGSYSFPLLKSPSEKRSFDLTADTYANLGTAFNGAGAGLMIRLGAIEKLFQSESYNARISNKVTSDFARKFELFFYTKPMINYVLYNASIEGSLFNTSKGLEIRENIVPWVYSQEFGITYAHHKLGINLHYNYNTHESEKAKHHLYGSIGINYRF
ncbi:lipid A deacylase LpxR family protein [Solitalea koreensis]|uniref:Lipid A deacylase LpxR family protein n=1 Tax=Solitalea koreensis TaxID=543615 RepID=A0A521DA42_9SPHI|nr:lipid A deacylase LpxR family protein [Solitalea koreensis]SMO68523.1 hypothetical protein SAMN06265350_106109 [Solitalea koreensis]